MSLSLAEIASQLGCEYRGEGSVEIEAVAPLDKAAPNAISFLTNPRYRAHLQESRAGAVILRPEDADGIELNLILSDNPYAVYAQVAALLYPTPEVVGAVHPTAVVEESAQVDPSAQIEPQCHIASGAVIGAGSYIGAGSVVGEGSRVGEGCHIAPNVTIYHGCELGNRVIIHSGTVIGSDGFGFANQENRWIKIPQVGGVRIGDDVEIGANTTVDRGALDDTVIEEGVKLDNQIQVAHNVHIGAHTAIAGCVGIAGSATIGRHCTIGGAAVILGHLSIADNVHITAMSLVRTSIKESGAYSSGMPLEPNKKWHRNFVRMKQLDEMATRIKQLEKKLDGD